MDVGLGTVPITLESRYAELDSPVLLTGIQAIVRVLLEQARLDRAPGATPAASCQAIAALPWAAWTRNCGGAASCWTRTTSSSSPALNEDLAVTMLSGTQQLDYYPGATVDGVFGMWYGKGPGVDRSADAFRVANAFGSHRNGGVLCIAGDDHGAHSSTFPPPDRPDLRGGDDAGAATGRRLRDHRVRPGRDRAVAVQRLVGGDEDHRRDGRAGGHGHRAIRAVVRDAGADRPAARLQHRHQAEMAGRALRLRGADVGRAASRRPRLVARQRDRPGDAGHGRGAGRHRHSGQGRITT